MGDTPTIAARRWHNAHRCPRFPSSPYPPLPSAGRNSASRFAVFIASVEITPIMCAKWATIRERICRFFSASRPMRWSAARACCRFRRGPLICITKLNWSSRCIGAASNVGVADAASMIFGYAVGIDLTRRDLQAEAKKSGRPGTWPKDSIIPRPSDPWRWEFPRASGAISLSIDGEVRQRGDLKDMIWSVAEIIAALSTYVEVAPGDLIFTGTPAGVGPIKRGESVRGMIAGVEPIEITFRE